MKNFNIIILVVVVGIAGLFIYRNSRQFKLPKGETMEFIENTDNQGSESETEVSEKNTDTEATEKGEKKIFITNGIKHSVPLDEIIGGGPQKDGIPSVDDPKFISITESSKDLTDVEPGIAVELNGVNRFYPYQILVWHEIINDTIGDQRILVTYCPLCLSGIVFDPLVKGERVEFGTSGKLWNSNLVMYDRKTDSLWPQVLGEAVVGEMTGTKLKVLESDIVRFGDWKKLHPDGEVLSRDTGAIRVYGRDPYGDYYKTPGIYFPVGAKDDRLEEKDFILGIVINEKAKAYYPPAIKEKGQIEDTFQGKTIVARYEADLDVVRLFEKKNDGTLERINPFASFWFSWFAAHPDTELYK